ncbi:MAG: cupredoxin family protein [Burkholderiaceae bacterium]|nr:cupredoxin family protein [Burkholderiaceae bacterium]
MKITRKSISALALAVLPALAPATGNHGAHGDKHDGTAARAGHDMAGMHEDMHESMAGTAGDPAQVSHTLAVEMDDTMRFTPDKISVKAGETVRFFIINKGKIAHEMIIGTAEELEEHAEMMRKMPNMVHKDANQIRLAPGQRGGIVWRFAKAGTVSYACLVPGHMEAGMVGTVEVK